MNFQSISDLNGAIASLADWGQKKSCEFFEIEMKKFRKSMKHKGLVSNSCSKSAPRQGLSAALDLRSLKSQVHCRGFLNSLPESEDPCKKNTGFFRRAYFDSSDTHSFLEDALHSFGSFSAARTSCGMPRLMVNTTVSYIRR